MVLEEFTAWDFCICSTGAVTAPSLRCILLLCGPGPARLLFLLPSGEDSSGSHWTSSLHPARPVGLGPALCLHNAYFTFSRGGPGPPSIRSSRKLVKNADLWVLSRPTGSESLGTVAREHHLSQRAVQAPLHEPMGTTQHT